MAYNPDASIPSSNALINRNPPDAFCHLFRAKAHLGLTFEQIAQAMNKDEVWVAALFYGQVSSILVRVRVCVEIYLALKAKASEEELRALEAVLQLRREFLSPEIGRNWYPNRGIGPIPPTDPVIYRLFEGVLVYGHAIKAVIHEKFGDGIMSMIDCKIHVDKKEDPKGDRVLLTFDGKFLPYAKW
ncbi:cyanate lyase C-terminal domain-containing protein [Russula emetica]|nr:cyanate lyase C-terminal domain-containing protein [Russula emetica]